MNTLKRKRYETIDVAKAFAIILVVVGHFENSYLPAGYDMMVRVIYMFHMPLFMFASGFIYAATWRPTSYKEFIAKKFRRLMVPYFATSVIVIAIKIAMAGVLAVDNPATWHTFVEMFYLPAAGYFLWFIWALWWMMVIIPFFGPGKPRVMLLAAAAILFFCSGSFPEIFCLRQTAGYLIFFVGGAVTSDFMKSRRMSEFSPVAQWSSVVLFSALAAYILVSGLEGYGPASKAVITLAVNVLGIAMSFTLSSVFLRTAAPRAVKVTLSISSASYIIYLFHTTFEGFAKGVAAKIGCFDWTPALLRAWLTAAAVIACGVVIPWWLARRVFPRWRVPAFLFGLPAPK